MYISNILYPKTLVELFRPMFTTFGAPMAAGTDDRRERYTKESPLIDPNKVRKGDLKRGTQSRATVIERLGMPRTLIC